MKALTVLQPWAQLLILGAKEYETRSWKTKHRGPLLIHAGRSFPDAARALCGAEPFRSILTGAGFRDASALPRGVLLGTVVVQDCLPAEQLAYRAPFHQEAAFGDFGPGRWAWQVRSPAALLDPDSLPRKPLHLRGSRWRLLYPEPGALRVE